MCAKLPITFEPDPVPSETIKNAALVRIEYRHNACLETAQNYASAFIHSDIRRIPRNNSRYLEYCELRRTCLWQQNNMHIRVIYSSPFLLVLVAATVIFKVLVTISSPMHISLNLKTISDCRTALLLSWCSVKSIFFPPNYLPSALLEKIIFKEFSSWRDVFRFGISIMPPAKLKRELEYITARYETENTGWNFTFVDISLV